jgi:hypothetical protein
MQSWCSVRKAIVAFEANRDEQEPNDTNHNDSRYNRGCQRLHHLDSPAETLQSCLDQAFIAATDVYCFTAIVTVTLA